MPCFRRNSEVPLHEAEPLCNRRLLEFSYGTQKVRLKVPASYRRRGAWIEDTARRAMSLCQLEELGGHAQQLLKRVSLQAPEPHSVGVMTWGNMNLYHLNDLMVMPLTAAFECSFVELVAMTPQDPKWFVSHWWGTPYHDTLTMLQFHAKTRNLGKHTTYWVCTFAMNQHHLEELAADDLMRTPFVRVIMSDTCSGTVMLMDDNATPFSRTWCTLETFISTTKGKHKSSALLFDVGVVIKAGTSCFNKAKLKWEVLQMDVAALTVDDCSGIASGTACFHDCVDLGDHQEYVYIPEQVASHAARADICAAHASRAEDKERILRLILGSAWPVESSLPLRHEIFDRVNQRVRLEFGPRALWGAADQLDLVEMDYLLDAGLAEVNARNHSGRTALMIATDGVNQHRPGVRERDVIPVVDQLLARNADPSVMDLNGLAPLHVALIAAAPNLVRVLLAGKADVHQENGVGRMSYLPPGVLPLHVGIFVSQMKRNSEAVAVLLEGRADPHHRSSVVMTPAQLSWYTPQIHDVLAHFGFDYERPQAPEPCAGACGRLRIYNHGYCCAACRSGRGMHCDQCWPLYYKTWRRLHPVLMSTHGLKLWNSLIGCALPKHFSSQCDDSEG